MPDPPPVTRMVLPVMFMLLSCVLVFTHSGDSQDGWGPGGNLAESNGCLPNPPGCGCRRACTSHWHSMTQALRYLVRDYVDANGDATGSAATPLRGVGMMQAHAPTGLVKSIYKPLVCLILQGAKQVTAGPDTYTFVAGQTALVIADVPVVSRVTRASRTEPYLAMAVELDTALLLDLSTQLGRPPAGTPWTPAVMVEDNRRSSRRLRIAAGAPPRPGGCHPRVATGDLA